MVSELRFYEITEGNFPLINPISQEKLDRVGAMCDFQPEMTLLDLACGQGTMMAQWAKEYGIQGTGIDISQVFLANGQKRIDSMGVADRVTLIQGDAAEYPQDSMQFDAVSCIGATWIGGGTAGTLNLMRRALNHQPHNLLLVGEVYWTEPPTDADIQVIGEGSETFAVGLPALLDTFEAEGLDLVYMVQSSKDDWDRYYARGWLNGHRWLLDNPDDPDADSLRAWIAKNRRAFLTVEREKMGWGIFVLAEKA